MFTMNNKKQPPEVFFKKAAPKNFSILTGKRVMLDSLFNQAADLQVYNFIKKRFQHKCFSRNFAKFLKMSILKKVCERLLLHNTELNFSSIYGVK